MHKSPIFIAILFAATCVLVVAFGLESHSASARTDSSTSGFASMPTLVYEVRGHRLTLPDFNHITFADMQSDQPGYVQFPQMGAYNPSRTWQPGQPLDSVLTLGDLDTDEFNISSLSLNDVKQMSATANIESGSGAVAQLLQAHPDAPFSTFDENFASKTATLPWQQWLIKDVPSLNQVPIAKLSPQLMQSLLSGVTAIADNYFSNVEHREAQVPAQMFLTGRVTCSNKLIPVAPEVGKAYSYVELTDFAGQNGPNYGKRLVSGDDQQVKGGCGPLAAVNGGKEPTGMSIAGLSSFKLVMRNVSEQERAEFWLNKNLCAHYPLIGKTCTPYFLRTIPVYSIEHNDVVLLPYIKGGAANILGSAPGL